MANTKALGLALMHIKGSWAKESPSRDVTERKAVVLGVFGVFMICCTVFQGCVDEEVQQYNVTKRFLM